MINFPEKFPEDEVGIITDDSKAKAIMLHFGVLDQVAQKRHPTDTTSVCIAETHATHWCLCARIWNNPDPKENGFIVISYPKAYVDLMTVQAVMATYLAGSTRIEVRPIQPPGDFN